MVVPVCSMCNGTHSLSAPVRQKDDSYKDEVMPCWFGGTSEEIYNGMKFLLAQFIRCGADGVFDSSDPYKESACEGCQYEREETLDHMWHYGEAVKSGNH